MDSRDCLENNSLTGDAGSIPVPSADKMMKILRDRHNPWLAWRFIDFPVTVVHTEEISFISQSKIWIPHED